MNSKDIFKALRAGKINSKEAQMALEKLFVPNTGLKNIGEVKNVSERKRDTPLREENTLHKKLDTDITERNKNAIAIIGMSGRYPGADNLSDYWKNLKNGVNSVVEIPKSRWDTEKYYDPEIGKKGKMYCKWMGFLDNVENFDPMFFSITPAEAEVMDPQHRIFLQEGYKAFEDAGYGGKELDGVKCGVYLGIMSNEYIFLLQRSKQANVNITGNSYAIGAARIPYYLNLKGPAIPTDTACSSSLVSTHLACQALKTHDIDMALVGGVTLYLTPETYIGMSGAGMLSRNGQCKTFDNEADGFVPGEGVGSMVLKRLSDAERDGDHIYGVIIGSGVNQDGKSNGITAPNVKSQIALEREIYEKNNIHPETISYIEAHGTGTKLGDPIELEALSKVFEKKTRKKGFCGIGSVKSNLGHTSAAAGIAGIQKVLLSMRHQKLAPTLNFKTPNNHFDFKNSPLYVNDKLKNWESRTPRRAAVSSFGYSGTNAHLVIEEYTKAGPVPTTQENGPILFVLSANDRGVLKRYAGKMYEYIKANIDINLYDLAYTLQCSRDSMLFRMSFVAFSYRELLNKLGAYLNNKPCATLTLGNTRKDRKKIRLLMDRSSRHILEDWLNRLDLKNLGEHWAYGLSIDWKRLYNNNTLPRRISLPTYPFLEERCWPELNDHIVQTSSREESAGTTKFLQKGWKPNEITSVKKIDKAVAILSNKATLELAQLIEEQLPEAEIIEEGLSRTDYQWDRYGAAIDLIGCSDSDDRSIDWIPWFQQLIDNNRNGELILLCVTKSLEAYKNTAINLTGATRAALFRMLQNEYGNLISRHIDIENKACLQKVSKQILEELNNRSVEDVEVCYRNGQRFSMYLKENKTHVSERNNIKIDPSNVLLITGGTKGIGALCAEHFVKQYGVKKLVLMGREVFPPRDQWDTYLDKDTPLSEKIKHIRNLEGLGAEVSALSIDLTDTAIVSRNLEKIRQEMGQIGGVIHSAGFADYDKPAFIRKELAAVSKVMAPKILGLETLYSHLNQDSLHFIVLFSSVSAIVPALGTGQSDYVMANAYMDYFADAHSNESTIVSVQWPSWKETGMGEAISNNYKQSGLLSHTNQEGLLMLDKVLSSGTTGTLLPAMVNPSAWNPLNLTKVKSNSPKPILYTDKKRLENQSPEQLIAQTETWLINLFSKELKIEVSKLHSDVPVQDYGIDSILIAQLSQTINKGLDTSMDPSIMMEYQTICELAVWLSNNHADALSKKFDFKNNGNNSKQDAPIQNNDRARANTDLFTQHTNGQDGQVKTWLMTLFSKEMKIAYSKLDPNVPIQDYGIDSILVAQLVQAINKKLNSPIDPSVMFEHPTINGLSDWITENHVGDLQKDLYAENGKQQQSTVEAQGTSVIVSSEKAPQGQGMSKVNTDIAVVGLSCDFPGSPSLDAYWDLLSTGKSAIAKVPKHRWGNGSDFYAGLMDNVTDFDSQFFLLPKEDAKAMDPQALITLEATLNLLHHAGYTKEEMKGKQVGVYLGARSQHQPIKDDLLKAKNPIVAVGQNYLSANISHFFDFRGPSLVLDTACSSALVGMNMAIQALEYGDIEAAVVGGVSVLSSEGGHKIFAQRNILGKESTFHLFDKRANGVVLGEGVGMVLLKPLQKAMEDGDRIYTVIKGMAINNDGRTAGPATPSIKAHKDVMKKALQKSNKKPEDISHIDVNGSGSEITDLLELKAIQAVYRQEQSLPCSLGSMKPNIGHPLCAEGIASFIKVALMLHHRKMIPFISGQEAMEHFDIDASPFYFNRNFDDWEGNTYTAAVNCFADGGTNVHVILESWDNTTEHVPSRLPLPPQEMNRWQIFGDGKTDDMPVRDGLISKDNSRKADISENEACDDTHDIENQKISLWT